MKALLSLLAFVAVQQPGYPPGFPAPPADPRIQLVAYNPDQVVSLRVAAGYAAVVELGGDEHIENVVVGDSSGWQVTPNHAGDRLIVKPLGSASQTNMVILTDSRRYVFMLEPSEGRDAGLFALRFTYPGATAATPGKAMRVADYRLSGTKSLFPVSMGDDGNRTTVTWDRQVPLPAIFAVDGRGREALVNGRMVAGDYVIEGIAPKYVLRLGNARATATRKLVGIRKK